MGEFKMPSLGADMEKGTLVAWNVKVGDHVKRGDILAVIETDKGAFDTECYEEGVIEKLLVEPGIKVPVGTALAIVRGEAAAAFIPKQPAPAPVAEKAPTRPVVTEATPAPTPATAPAHVRASPLARKVAAELGVDLSTVHGTGPGGVIDRADVEHAAEAKQAAPPGAVAPGERTTAEFQAGMRRAIAAAMARSNREIPHYYLSTRIDMTLSVSWLERENAKRSIQDRLLSAVLTLKAVALALRDVPDLNGFWLEDQHRLSESIHIGFAVALRKGGLVTPAIHNADKKNLDELMDAMRDVIDRARGGHLRASEMSDPTITVTNLGDLGAESVFGVIYPPQVALVGFGKITEQPWAANGMLGVHPVLNASLAGDHRATDGHCGAQFLDALNRHLQEPEKL
ncbi:MAG: dihydrolipoamide acetyltransferase family protein [Chthoniobacter sp.]|nr:dihydrolipoamide acetyltransferase family protein [Chthoniobacter sp.]